TGAPSAPPNDTVATMDYGIDMDKATLEDLVSFTEHARDDLGMSSRDDTFATIQVRKAYLVAARLGIVKKEIVPNSLNVEEAKRRIDELRARLAEVGKGSATQGAAPRPAGRAPRSPSINARMIETLQANHDAMGWNSRQWAEHLKCAKSSVVETPT